MDSIDECIAPYCSSTTSTPNVELFYLPALHKKALAWLKVLNRNDLICTFKGGIMHRVCSKHFSQKQYSQNMNFSKPRLATYAIPDIIYPKKDAKDSSKDMNAMLNDVEDAASHENIIDNDVALKCNPDSIHVSKNSVIRLKDLTEDCSTKKRVVRLQLPPGVSTKDFASSDALKKITNHLSGIIDDMDQSGNKCFSVQLPLQSPIKPVTANIEQSSYESNISSTKDDAIIDVSSPSIHNSSSVKRSSEEHVCGSPLVPSAKRKCQLFNKQQANSDVDSLNGDGPSSQTVGYKPQVVHGENVQLREIYKNKLLSKIEKQKNMLFRRGKELCKYRLLLNKLREAKLEAPQISLAECLKALKGNMYDHALELLYSQLATKKSDGKSQQSDVVCTPKVLEAALLLSVAGKKAYKALCESVKLPPYSVIIKWKKLIRTNPQFYRKLFPQLRAKFFKKIGKGQLGRKKMKQENLAKEESSTEDNKGCGSSTALLPELNNPLYTRLMNEQSKFDNIFVEQSTTLETDKALSTIQDDSLDMLVTKNSKTIDFNVNAVQFIEEIKRIEKPEFYMEEWEAIDTNISLVNYGASQSSPFTVNCINSTIEQVINSTAQSSPVRTANSSLFPENDVTINSKECYEEVISPKMFTDLGPVESVASIKTVAESDAKVAVRENDPYLQSQSTDQFDLSDSLSSRQVGNGTGPRKVFHEQSIQLQSHINLPFDI